MTHLNVLNFLFIYEKHFMSEKIAKILKLLDSLRKLRKLHVSCILNTLKVICRWYKEKFGTFKRIILHLFCWKLFVVSSTLRFYFYKWTPYFLNAFSVAIFGGKIFFLQKCSFYVLHFPFQVIHIRICEI